MNNDKLTKILREKFDQFEVDLPENDWKLIEQRIARKSTPIIQIFWAAAASVAVLIGAFFLFNNPQQQEVQIYSAIKQTQPTTTAPIPNNTIASSAANNPLPSAPRKTPKQVASPTQKETKAVISTADPIDKNDILRPEVVNDKQQPSATSQPTTKKETATQTNTNQTNKTLSIEEAEALLRQQHNATYAQNNQPNTQNKGAAQGWSVGASAGLNPSLTSSLQNPDILLASSDFDNSSMMHMKSFTNIKAEHELPISVGLSVSKEIIPRLSVVTGVNYSLVRSKFSTIGTNDLITEAEFQNLHYIGIPVQLSYRFLETRLINLYASAGGAGEKGLVMQNTHRTYDENERPTKTEFTQSGIKGLQWSLTATAGIAVNILDDLNIYFEPGFTWYIPSASQPTSIRTEKPYNLSLAAGLRFNFR